MANDFAPLLRSIWSDDDFRALAMDAQHVYLMLMSHPDRNSAGVLSLTKRKWTRLAADLTSERLTVALDQLDDAGFVVLDQDTEEVLVRAFVRRAKVYTHIRMLANALREMQEVESDRLRSALGQELVRIPRLAIPERNERNGRSVDEAVATQQRLDEVASMMCDLPPEPPGQGTPHPMAHPMAHPPVVVAGAVAVAGTGTAVGSMNSLEKKSLESNARGKPRTGLCREHPRNPARNCSGCAADRKAAS